MTIVDAVETIPNLQSIKWVNLTMILHFMSSLVISRLDEYSTLMDVRGWWNLNTAKDDEMDMK